MDSQNTAWLMADYISTQSTANRINEKLFSMLQKTGYVKNIKQLQKDISERTQKYGAKINDKLNIYHAASKGTTHLCASIVIDNNNQINAIIAYKEKSYFCLKRMAGLLEVLIDLTDSTKQQKLEKLKQTNDLSAFFEEEFKEKGISIFDQEV